MQCEFCGNGEIEKRLQCKLKNAMKTAFGAEGFNYAWM